METASIYFENNDVFSHLEPNELNELLFYLAVNNLHLDGLLKVLFIHHGNFTTRVSFNELFQDIFVEHLTLQAHKLKTNILISSSLMTNNFL